VTLTLSAADPASTVTEMCVSNTSTCTAWRPYTTSLAWSLTSGAGEKTVYATFRNAEGTTSDTVTDTIQVDATRPVDGTLAATRGDGVVDLSWSGFSDAASGVASYVVQQATSSAPGLCTTGTRIAATTDTSLRASGLTNGTTYGFRVCAVDGAGNLVVSAEARCRHAGCGRGAGAGQQRHQRLDLPCQAHRGQQGTQHQQ
jgi:PKD repeat protein